MTMRKARFHGHEALNAAIRKDWQTAIALSPDSFEAFLYRPIESAPNASGGHYEEDQVTDIDVNQETLEYADYEKVAVLECPDEMETFFVQDSGTANLGEGDGVLLLRIASDSVPRGSALEWDEETADGIRTVFWYVQQSLGFGTANVGNLYACVPLRNFEAEPSATENETATSGEPEANTEMEVQPSTNDGNEADELIENNGVTYL